MMPGPTVPIQAKPFGLGGSGSSPGCHASSPERDSLGFAGELTPTITIRYTLRGGVPAGTFDERVELRTVE